LAQSDERFSFGLGTVVGVQAVGTANVTNVTITGLLVRTGNFRSQRFIEMLFTVDGTDHRLIGEFEDDTFYRQTLVGTPIRRTEDTKEEPQ